MTTLLRAMLVVGVFVVTPVFAVAADGERHSGTVVSVDPTARTLVPQEHVENGKPRRLEVHVPANAAVVNSERIPDAQVTRLDAPFVDRRVDLGDVRPGDFVVVEGQAPDGSTTASLVMVTLRAGAGA